MKRKNEAISVAVATGVSQGVVEAMERYYQTGHTMEHFPPIMLIAALWGTYRIYKAVAK